MSLGIVKAELNLDGTIITDWRSFEENEIEVGKEIELATGTKYAPTVPKYGFSMEYVPPPTGAVDFAKFIYNEGTLVLTYDGGTTATYSAVHLLKKGSGKLDGKTELSNTYSFVAGRRDPLL